MCEALECLHASQAKEKEHGGSHRGKDSSVNQSRSQSQSEEEPKMARPFHPIPMPYTPLNVSSSTEDKGKALVVSAESTRHHNELTVSVLSHQYCVASWWDKLHVLLLRKASLVYLVMARSSFNAKRYVCVLGQYLHHVP